MSAPYMPSFDDDIFAISDNRVAAAHPAINSLIALDPSPDTRFCIEIDSAIPKEREKSKPNQLSGRCCDISLTDIKIKTPDLAKHNTSRAGGIDIPTWTNLSPWIDAKKQNLFKYEFQLAAESLSGASFAPMPIYSWILDNGGVDLFFRGLARFAPMFPTLGYRNKVAVWISPPPSGLGNAIYLVMGRDAQNKLRLMGGNYFSDPQPRTELPKSSAAFFTDLDCSNERKKLVLIKETVEKSIQPADVELIRNIQAECAHISTMPIYITVLTNAGSLFHVGKAIIEGERSADFSYECFGEIK